MTKPAAGTAGEKTPLRRVVMASLIGTTIEWYDFFLYGSAAALVFNQLFFPEYDPLTGTLLAFAQAPPQFPQRQRGEQRRGEGMRPEGDYSLHSTPTVNSTDMLGVSQNFTNE